MGQDKIKGYDVDVGTEFCRRFYSDLRDEFGHPASDVEGVGDFVKDYCGKLNRRISGYDYVLCEKIYGDFMMGVCFRNKEWAGEARDAIRMFVDEVLESRTDFEFGNLVSCLDEVKDGR
ncbi:hypothetical protein HNV12_00305 [Methanococcoides sp. SA1]|nr:hypothetical protein [Methanococcoides sp. SA1]